MRHIDEITERREPYEMMEELFMYNIDHPFKGPIFTKVLIATNYIGEKIDSLVGEGEKENVYDNKNIGSDGRYPSDWEI